MILYNNLVVYNKQGFLLNPSKVLNIVYEIQSSGGTGAILEIVTDDNNNIISIDVLNSGVGYDTTLSIVIKDLNTNATFQITNSDIVLNSENGIQSVNIPVTIPTSVWTYPSFFYRYSIDLKEVSVNLIENESLFFLEKVYNNSNNQTELNFVKTQNNTLLELVLSEDVESDKDYEVFDLFDVSFDDVHYPFIERFKEKEFLLQNGSTDVLNNVSINNQNKFFRVLNTSNPNPIQTNILIQSDEEGVFQQVLYLFEHDVANNKKYKIAEFLLYGEVEGEDERFQTILNNIGFDLDLKTSKIFRESDVNEDDPDFVLMNRKRKEFILEHSNILPYIGSYKSIFNILNFFGYDNIFIKEYFKNIDKKSVYYNKKYPVDFNKENEFKNSIREYIKTSLNGLLSNPKIIKTNLLGLFFLINEPDGTEDQFGYLNTVDTFNFTFDEILIKLYSLKKFLQEKIIPLNARIIDINAEGFYFEKINVRNWLTKNKIFEIKNDRILDFECNKESLILNEYLYSNLNNFRYPKIDIVLHNGQITLILLDGGSGFLEPVNIQLVGGGYSTPASVSVTMTPDNSSIQSITMLSNGSGYQYKPDIIITPLPTQPTSSVTLNQIENLLVNFFNDFSVEFEDSEIVETFALLKLNLNTDITIEEIGDIQIGDFYFNFRHANIEAQVLPGGSIALNILDGGYGYVSTPTITLVGGSPTIPATIGSVSVVGLQISSITLSNSGSGYSYPPEVIVSGGLPNSLIGVIELLGVGDFYEMEWIVKGDDNPFEFSVRGSIVDLKNYTIKVPFAGNYTVQLKLYDTQNNVISNTKKSCFKAITPSVEFNSIRNNYVLENVNDTKIEDVDGNILEPHQTTSTIEELSQVKIKELDFYNYQDEQEFLEYPKFEIKDIFEENLLVGEIDVIDDVNNKVTFKNSKILDPEIAVGDVLFFNNGSDDKFYPSVVLNIQNSYKIKSIDIVTNNSFSDNYIIDYTVSPYNIGFQTVNKNNWFGTTPYVSGFFYPIFNCSIQTLKIIEAPLNFYFFDLVSNSYVDSLDYSNILSEFFGPTLDQIRIRIVGSSGVIFDGTSTLPSAVTQSSVQHPILNKYYYSINLNSLNVNPTVPNNGYDEQFAIEIVPLNNSSSLFGKVVLRSYVNDINTYYSDSAGVLRSWGEISFFLIVDIQLEKVLFNPNQTYVLPPNFILYDNYAMNTYQINFDFSSVTSEITFNKLPIGIKPFYKCYKEIENTILFDGNPFYDPQSNPNGIKFDYLRLFKERQKTEKFQIVGKLLDYKNLINGVEVLTTLNHLQSIGLKERSKIKISKNFVLNFDSSTTPAPNTFNVDFINKKIIINNPTNLNELETSLIKNSSVLELTTYTNSTFSNIYNEQNLLIIDLNTVGTNLEMFVKELDSSLNSVLAFNPNHRLTIEIKEFVVDVVNVVSNFTTTFLYLDFNKCLQKADSNLNDYSTGEWFVSFPNYYGEFVFKIKDFGTDVSNLSNISFVRVENEDFNIYRISTEFEMFNEPFDRNKFKQNIQKTSDIKILSKNTIEELSIYSIDDLDLRLDVLCTFEITSVSPNGTIQFDNEPVFTFSSSATNLNNALIELKNNIPNDNILSWFDYYLDNPTSPTKIIAISKFFGVETLGKITFGGGVTGSYSFSPNISHTHPVQNFYDPLVQNGFYGLDNINLHWNDVLKILCRIWNRPNWKCWLVSRSKHTIRNFKRPNNTSIYKMCLFKKHIRRF